MHGLPFEPDLAFDLAAFPAVACAVIFPTPATARTSPIAIIRRIVVSRYQVVGVCNGYPRGETAFPPRDAQYKKLGPVSGHGRGV